MSPERYRQVKQIFQAVLDVAPQARAAYLTETCAGDDELRGEVVSLLAAHDDAGEFIEVPAVAAITHSETEDGALSVVGQRIGPYQVLREIGHGGMGTVYLATRADDQFKKRVAIKLVRRGMDSDFIVRRFRHERQILASLDHPNIARLFDGGTTEDGLPYFVMEYIEGLPMDEYCDRQQLTTVERLELFRTVCAAVQYAHQNLVVHRDLKPGNILITADGTPKLLDFGIAKLLNPELTGDTIDVTMTGMKLMTPGYASPEQARGEAITTASDVYSLGVVLYELLTGHRPYHVSARPPHEVMRVICEEQPSKPSTAVSKDEVITNSDGSAKTTITPEMVSRTREGQPDKLRKRLSGDLDNIVLMALRKEPQRRYTSVSQFAEDLRRHLTGLPVIAREDTVGYRTGKFVTRHKAGVAAAVLIAIALLGGMMTTMWQARKAERRFNDVRKLANSFLFELHDAIEKLPGSTPARALLVKRALEYLNSLGQEATNDPTLQRELATAYEKVAQIQGDPFYANLGDIDGSLQSYRKASVIREALMKAAPQDATARAEWATCLTHLGDLLGYTRSANDALEMYRKALQLREQLVAEQPTQLARRQELASSYEVIGDALHQKGDLPGTLENFRKSLTMLEELTRQEPDNAKVRRGLAVMHYKSANAVDATGDKPGGLEHARQALTIFSALATADPMSTVAQRDLAMSYNALGDLLWGADDLNGAMENYRAALVRRERLSAADPANAQLRRDAAVSIANVGYVLAQQGDAQSAIEHYQKTLTMLESLFATNPGNADAQRDLATYRAYYGDVWKILAGQKHIASSQQITAWQSAIAQYQQSLKLVLAMREQGTLRGQDAGQPEKLNGEIAQCQAALARLNGKQ